MKDNLVARRQAQRTKKILCASTKKGWKKILDGHKDEARELWEKSLELYPENKAATRGLERLKK